MPPQSLSLTWTHQELLKFWNWIKNTKSYDICHLMCFSYKFQGEMLSLRISTWFTFENWMSLSYSFWAHCVILVIEIAQRRTYIQWVWLCTMLRNDSYLFAHHRPLLSIRFDGYNMDPRLCEHCTTYCEPWIFSTHSIYN